MEILPEIRFLENRSLFINAGIGLGSIRSSQFSGDFYRGSLFTGTEVNYPITNGNYTYFTVNGGASLSYKNIGMNLSLGFRTKSTYEVAPAFPNFSLQQFTSKIGVIYKIN